MKFSKEMIAAKEKLESSGHEVMLPCDTEKHIAEPGFIDDLDADYEHCIENDIMRKCFRQVADSDAILVLNHDKNGIPGYVGTSTLMEIGIAHLLDKKIFLLNPSPDPKKYRWAHEVRIVRPTCVNGDLGKVR